MFGRSYFGASYYGPSYFGGGVAVTPPVTTGGGGVPWPLPEMAPPRQPLNRPSRFYPSPEGERDVVQEVLLAARPLVYKLDLTLSRAEASIHGTPSLVPLVLRPAALTLAPTHAVLMTEGIAMKLALPDFKAAPSLQAKDPAVLIMQTLLREQEEERLVLDWLREKVRS